MASRYWVNGGGSLAWGTSANWSATSGGAGGASLPTNVDDVFFDANSPSMTGMSNGRAMSSLNFTGYNTANTFTNDFLLTIGGTGASNNLTLINGLNLSGGGLISIGITGGAHTLTSNGCIVPRLSLAGSGATHTLADNFNCTDLNIGSSTHIVTINGFKFIVTGALTHNSTSGSSLGTTSIEMVGANCSWSGTTTSNRGLGLALTINTAGTFTVTGTVYYSGTLTHTAGTWVTTGSTIICQTVGATLNIPGITLADCILRGGVTHTISSAFNVLGRLSLGLTTGSTVINGSSINVSGGVRYDGQSAAITGTTQINCIATQTLDAPNRTTGDLDLHLNLNAPGGTITISPNFFFNLNDLDIQDDTTVVTAIGSFTPRAASSGGDGFSAIVL